ncbi:MAG: hypothetical protein QM785_20105 [Pyrinomonadaceae bacterium]
MLRSVIWNPKIPANREISSERLRPDEIRISGARSCFTPENARSPVNDYLEPIFRSIGMPVAYSPCPPGANVDELDKVQKLLVTEIKKDTELAGVYSFDGNHIRVYRDKAMFSWDEDDSRYRERRLEKAELEYFQSFLVRNDADDAPPFMPCTAPYCPAKELLMIDRKGGRRVYFNNNYDTDEVEFAAGLTDIFKKWREQPSVLKYALSRDVPGLEVVFASDDVRAETVWKGAGDDIRIAGYIPSVRKDVNGRLNALNEEESDEAEVDYEALDKKRTELYEKTLYEGYSWYKIVNGNAETGVAKPPQIDIIPIRDAHAIQPTEDQWKARTSSTEIRASENGLFKLVRGQFVRIREGSYSSPLISPDGRWVLVSKDDEGIGSLVRVDLTTNKEQAISTGPEQYYIPAAYVPFLSRALIAEDLERYSDEENYRGEDLEAVSDDPPSSSMRLVDLLTGKIFPITGEVRPLYQQSFRPLQSTSKPNEFWAAIPNSEKNETLVGIYNAKTLTFTQNLRIPKIRFNSMQMWADEAARRIYFVYRGHVLTLPLPPEGGNGKSVPNL